MSAFNLVVLMGNLTRDPELRKTPKGTAVCAFGLAVNESFRDADGKDRESVTFVDVDAFGRHAETLAKYLSKGRPVLVEGRLRLDTWEKDGERKSKLKVVLDAFQFIGPPDRKGGGS